MTASGAARSRSRGAVVVLSGGQDSTTCLYWALREFGEAQVAALSFAYGQRHAIELDAARDVARIAGVEHHVLPIDTFAALGGSALTDRAVAVPDAAAASEGLPITFVPGRNLIFLTFAAAFAYPRGWSDLVTGVAQTDYSGYPDCRDATLRALEQSLRLGMEHEFRIHTPLMQRSKRETIELALELGAWDALAWSHTCYNGERPGCGRCAACELRAKGFREAGRGDPLFARYARGAG